ncbi:MAG: hypothetical protein P8100_04420 [bacterium]
MSGRKFSKSALFLLMIVFGIISCQKDTNVNVNFQRGIESAQNYAFAQQMMTQVMATYFKALTDSTLSADAFNYIDGAAVYYYPDQEPKRMIFDYPSYGVSDGYGHTRGGKFNASTTQDFTEDNAVISFSFDNFRYDSDSVEVDSMFLFNLGKKNGKDNHYRLTLSQLTYQFKDSSGVFTFDLDQEFAVFKYNSSYYTHPRDSLGIYGTLHGNTVRNIKFTAQNTSDSSLLFSYDCRWLKTGITGIETEMFTYPVTAYFQEPDTCGNQFLVTIDSNPFPRWIEE